MAIPVCILRNNSRRKLLVPYRQAAEKKTFERIDMSFPKLSIVWLFGYHACSEYDVRRR